MEKNIKIVAKIFLFLSIFYLIIMSYYFLNLHKGSGDESLFISDLELIKNKGWLVAIKKSISLPYMVLVYPFSFFMENYVALRLVNGILIFTLLIYFYRNTSNNGSLFGYLFFFIGTVSYFLKGSNDTLMFVCLIIFINEVYLLEKDNSWNSALAFSSLVIASFTRELIIVYIPLLIVCFYIIYVKRPLLRIKTPIFIFFILILMNLPSLLVNGRLSYDLKPPPSTSNANWTQRQYLAQLMVNDGVLKNYHHPSWEETEEYLLRNGKKSLPNSVLAGLTLNINLTIKEFFKDLYYCFFYGFRQLGLIILIPILILGNDIYKYKKILINRFIPLSLLMMLSIFSLIIISYVELRWLAPIFIMSIVYYNDLEMKKSIDKRIVFINYVLLIIMAIYGTFNIINKF